MTLPFFSFLILSFFFLFTLSTVLGHLEKGSCSDFGSDPTMSTLGGLRESQGTSNDADVEHLARFAVDEHNKKENSILEFARVVKAKEQVVAGTLHHLTIEAIDAGKKKLYEAKVWVKPWMNFKELQEFKHSDDSTSFTASDLGANREGHGPGWKEVPAHDPEVQNAANHAIKSIQQRSNSLFPYELQQVTHAKAEVVLVDAEVKVDGLMTLCWDEVGQSFDFRYGRPSFAHGTTCLKVADNIAKFNLGLKVKRGNKEEKFNVEVHKNEEGNFQLHQMGNIDPEY